MSVTSAPTLGNSTDQTGEVIRADQHVPGTQLAGSGLVHDHPDGAGVAPGGSGNTGQRAGGRSLPAAVVRVCLLRYLSCSGGG